MDLVILGTIGLDDIKTPFGSVKGVLGGSGVYSAVAASYFTKPGLVSIAGADLPTEAREIFKSRQVDLAGVKFKDKTFRWSGAYEFDMNEVKTLLTELNSLTEFDAEVPEAYRQAKFLFLGNTDPAHQAKVLSQMKSKPFVVIDSMNLWITNKKDELLSVMKKADMTVINEGEARQLFGTPNLIKAGKMALKLGPAYVVIKKGEHGALLFSDSEFFSLPGYPLEEVRDPTGAGDSFAGAMIGYLAKTGDTSESNVRKAVVYGSAIASCCAEEFSLEYTKNVTVKEIKERYYAFKRNQQF